MLDFLMVATKPSKKGCVEVYPKFIIKKSNDLMIRGRDFYAIWDEENRTWSQDEQTAIRLIDNEVDIFAKKATESMVDSTNVIVKHMWDAESGVIDTWHKYVQKQCRDSYKPLDEKLIFANDNPRKTDYSSKRLPYALEDGDISAYDEMMKVLYDDDERHKLEWAVGSIVSGDSKKIQKFEVLYGGPGTGKGTFLDIVGWLFGGSDGYISYFDAKSLSSNSASFPLEQFKKNPLVAIQLDGDLSRIEDNTKINSLVSHEELVVNEKFKSTYTTNFKCFLFMGTNKPVKITDAKSGLMRRLIDVSPTGNKIEGRRYNKLKEQVKFELGAIAKHCLDVYLEDPHFYDAYVPETMIGATNDTYNFVMDNYLIFERQEYMTLSQVWAMYQEYVLDTKMPYPLHKRALKEELKNYFKDYKEKWSGNRNVFFGFLKDKFTITESKEQEEANDISWLDLKKQHSLLDDFLSDYKAQEANEDGLPGSSWAKCKTKLKDISTSALHYTLGPETLVTIDFDLKNEKGEKDFELNKKAAAKWKPTYAELSQGGQGIHLEYIYTGDVNELAGKIEDDIEIKKFTGLASLRRKVTKCNDIPIATISSGLPIKEKESKMISQSTIKSERGLISMIERNLNKEFGSTAVSVQFIKKILDEAYANGVSYDLSTYRPTIIQFAAQSTHQADKCLQLVSQMKFKSDTPAAPIDAKNEGLAFFDVEIYPNLFLVCWKLQGEGKPIVDMVNPKPEDVERLFKLNLVGFNCRRYDNHILYAATMGYSVPELYNLSQNIISKGSKDCFFGNAYDISYTDIYDYAVTKQSLKKWEIKLGIHHLEMGIPWDKPVPDDMIEKVIEYCHNDVLATEAVFNATKADFVAREILADISGGSVNDTTNTLTGKLIFGNDKTPQTQFNYRNLGEKPEGESFTWKEAAAYARGETDKKPVGKVWFPGYLYKNGKSTYRDEDGTLDENGDERLVKEGGYVFAVPGMYGGIKTQDVASMHPHSAIAEQLFGPKYTKIFEDLVNVRVYIKHGEFDKASQLFDGKLTRYLNDPSMAKALADALKIAINSVYGLTSAKFSNLFKDERNIDNIVAKRGALFMIDLKHFVWEEGFIVAHIKTDSIKIPDITEEMITKVRRFGECYGYKFETEDEFDKLCLVNDAVYVAKDTKGNWHATGAQFAEPMVYKSFGMIPMIIKKVKYDDPEIRFNDLCVTNAVTTALYLDKNENLPEGEHDYEFIGKIGQFVPIKAGCGGGDLLRISKDGDKYSFATGAKGFKWLEAESCKALNKEGDVDMGYFDDLINDAKEAIEGYGDFDWFISDEKYVPAKIVNGKPEYTTEVPWDERNDYTK